MNLEPGQTATRTLVVTPDAVRKYAEITGDYNPLHFDEEFVSQTRFGRLIAQGGMATGVLHALVAMDLPGPGTVFINQQWAFPNPVYIGDTLTARGTVRYAASGTLRGMDG
jgi:acyl dehydratase